MIIDKLDLVSEFGKVNQFGEIHNSTLKEFKKPLKRYLDFSKFRTYKGNELNE